MNIAVLTIPGHWRFLPSLLYFTILHWIFYISTTILPFSIYLFVYFFFVKETKVVAFPPFLIEEGIFSRVPHLRLSRVFGSFQLMY